MENAQFKLTDEMVLKYEKLLYKIYNSFYSRTYHNIKEDLIQEGFLGVCMAYIYEHNRHRDVPFVLLVWKCAQAKMCKYIEKNYKHIHRQEENPFYQTYETFYTMPYKDEYYDLINVVNTLRPIDKKQVADWCAEKPFHEHNRYSSRNAQKVFSNIKKVLKRRLHYDEL